MIKTFYVNSVEYKKAYKWYKSHKCSWWRKKKDKEWVFIETAIGTAISIRCNVCKEECNVTDYDNW